MVPDAPRLGPQLTALRDHLINHPDSWFTLGELETVLRYPQPCTSARLRDLRKKKYGSHEIGRRRVDGGGLWEYTLVMKP